MVQQGEVDRPLGSYAALMAVWGLSFGGFLLASSRRRGLPPRVDLRDLLVVGMATHKLSRTITRERVTAPVRAPFTEPVEDPAAGRVRERPRGEGLRRAIGYLLTCPYCTGPWVASSLICGMVAAPSATRLLSSTFAAVTIADFLHQGFDALSAKTAELKRPGAEGR
jgi:hypothetical protein